MPSTMTVVHAGGRPFCRPVGDARPWCSVRRDLNASGLAVEEAQVDDRQCDADGHAEGRESAAR